MKLKILKGNSNIGKEVLEIATNHAKIAICFGEERGTGEIYEHVNPVFNGLTSGSPNFDALFVLRNPENCVCLDFTLDSIPIYMEKKIKTFYIICKEFEESKERKINVIDVNEPIIIGDLKITAFMPDISNQTTAMLLVEAEGKKVLITGDFRNYDYKYIKSKLEAYLSLIGDVDYYFIDGKFLGKEGIEFMQYQDLFQKLKNIMKFYKQVFVLQSETDVAMARKMYDVSLKTKKIFIESTLLSNLTTECAGSAPNPITGKKVYSYIPLVLDNRSFEFKKNYVTHFYIHNANNKMEKEKFTMNITPEMLQDIQVFQKEDIIYDACIIFAMKKELARSNKELEEFINMMKDIGMDYYEIYSIGLVDFDLINMIISKVNPINVIPIDYEGQEIFNQINNFKRVNPNEIINL